MAHEYYCTNCGKKLNQGIVLFDMQRLLIETSTEAFQYLKFRMTEAELKAFIHAGMPAEDGFRACEVTFAQLMQTISNKNNLNDPRIAGLTREDAMAFIEETAVEEAPKAEQKNDPFAFSFGMPSFGEEEEQEETPAEPEEEKPAKPTPEAIRALEESITASLGKTLIKGALQKELQLLLKPFQIRDKITIWIQEYTEMDDKNQAVLEGFRLHYIMSDRNDTVQARICSHCGYPVFEHAGTAKHQAVVFIGDPASGKTSTIIALTHYAVNHMYTGELTEIWRGCKTIPAVKELKLLDQKKVVQEHQFLYGEGYAPPRTEANTRADAYSVTLWIKNARGQYNILTLTDLPGEICKNDATGAVDMEKVQNEFQVALSCDAFVVCFDTTLAAAANSGSTVLTQQTHETPGQVIARICAQADTFQTMRAKQNGASTYVPTMLLFNKCADLENNVEVQEPRLYRPMDRVYMFRREKTAINSNGIYGAVRKIFNQSGKLAKSYNASIRCSPYGYRAPARNDADAPERLQVPSPKNIDLLMSWLLNVTRCTSVEGQYSPLQDDLGTGEKLENFYFSRTQFRNEAPCENDELHEAIARATLFENPGSIDRMVLEEVGQNAAVRIARKLKQKVGLLKANDCD